MTTHHVFGSDFYKRIMVTCLCAGMAVAVATCIIFVLAMVGIRNVTLLLMFVTTLLSLVSGFLIGSAAYVGLIALTPSRWLVVPYFLNFPLSFLAGKYIAGSFLWLLN